MKQLHPAFLALILMGGAATASKSTNDAPAPVSEPIRCYETVWGNKENPGLGLTVGQAVTLCSGATDANRVVQCFARAWAHPDDGELGLTAGQSVALCKTNSLQ